MINVFLPWDSNNSNAATETRKEDISEVPELAFYMGGKALEALSPEWQKPTDPY